MQYWYLILIGYILGSIPWGLVIAKVFCNIDPRLEGSKSIGATNVSRLCGFGYGVLTLLCDLLKGVLPVFLAKYLDQDPLFISLVAFSCVLGHVYSCFMHFKGGKAVATSIGVLIPIVFWQLLISAILCIVVIWRFGYVSLGSLTLVTTLPIILAINGIWLYLPLSICLWALVTYRHKENIIRLKNGEEKSFLKSRQK